MDYTIEINVIIVLILLILSALFSCFETAITASSRARAHRLANEGVKKAKILEELLKNRDKVISTMLLGNNAINILASAIATSVLIKLFGDSGLIYATIVMTILVLVFSEVLPKTYAIHHSDKVALFFASTIKTLVTVFFPFIDSIHKIVNIFLNCFSSKNKNNFQDKHLLERNEIRDTVYLKHKEGSIYSYDRKMIEGVLDLSEIEICEVMIHRKDIISLNIEIENKILIKQALELKHSRIPLWRDNPENIIGVLNIRKLLKNLNFAKNNESFDWKDFNLKPYLIDAWFVPASNSLRAQLSAFRRKKQKIAFVVDEYGSLQGLVTLEDILEEIVGEIKEQDEINAGEIIKLRDGYYKIAGKSMIRNINKRLDWNLEEENEGYNLAGLIISKLGRVPDEQEKFTIDNYQFEILQKKHHQIKFAKAKLINK